MSKQITHYKKIKKIRKIFRKNFSLVLFLSLQSLDNFNKNKSNNILNKVFDILQLNLLVMKSFLTYCKSMSTKNILQMDF